MLVGRGKHGAGPQLAEHAHRSVQLEGTLIYRDGNTMVELSQQAVNPDGSEPIPPVAEPVEVSGQLMAFDDQLVLEVDPATVTWIH